MRAYAIAAVWLLITLGFRGFSAEGIFPPCVVKVTLGESIQKAIEAAPDQAVICLPEGTWQEHIVVKKSVIIKGEGPNRTTLEGLPGVGKPVVWIIGDVAVEIHGLRITQAKNSFVLDMQHTLTAQGSARVTIENVVVSNGEFGIWLWEKAQARILNSTIEGNDYGVYLSDSAHAFIEGCAVRGNRMCNVALTGESQATIINSNVADAGGYNISVDDRAQIKVSKCSILGSTNGLVAFGRAEIIVEESIICGAKHDGVLLMNDSRTMVSNSTISQTHAGIAVKDSSQIKLVGCVIKENEVGVGLRHMGSALLINNFITDNKKYGIALVDLRCFPENPWLRLYAAYGYDITFKGFVAGQGNFVPGPEELGGNRLAAVCPQALSFLITMEGGAWPQR